MNNAAEERVARRGTLHDSVENDEGESTVRYNVFYFD